MGSAAIIQAMVFGNMNENSGSGVVSSRNRQTGEKMLHGEYLKGQGDEIRSGTKTPYTVGRLQKEQPALYQELEAICRKLEEVKGDVRNVEFTVEKGKLYILQTRKEKNISGAAMDKIKDDMTKEGVINSEVFSGIAASHVYFVFDPKMERIAITKGLSAGSDDVTTGQIVFDSKTAVEWAKQGRLVILIRPDTSASDYEGLVASVGVVTTIGGTSSHAAENARQLNKVCITGCEMINIASDKRSCRINGVIFKEGNEISLDGLSGEVLRAIPIIKREIKGNGN